MDDERIARMAERLNAHGHLTWSEQVELLAEVRLLRDGVAEAADEIAKETGVDDHYLTLQLRALLDAS